MLTPFDEELVVGSRFADRFQILGVVGRGSMGVVYQARHELMGRMVAIKMLRGQLQMDERTLRRFEREARAASRFDHPNLISVHDFGVTASRQPYLVMDFVQGRTLYEIQRSEDHITPDRAVRIFTQVCDALHHAHLQGVIHRDLKPSNIMLVHKDSEADFVKVFDMGIAKIAWGEDEDKEPLTNTGEVCGSPIYLSPEQCTHQPLDARTDIYSLGVVMYELLTGVPPLMGHTVYDTIYMHVHEIPKPFAEVRPDLAIPSRLERIVFKALEKNPDDRYQSMQELKWEIQASLQESDPHLRVLPPEALLGKRRRPVDQPGHGADKTALVKEPNGRISNPAGQGVPAGQMTPGPMTHGPMTPGAMGSMTPGAMGSMTPGAMGSMTPGAMGSMTPGAMTPGPMTPTVMPPAGMTPGPMTPGAMTPGMPMQAKSPATQNLSLKQSIEMRSMAANAAGGSRNGSQPDGSTGTAKIAIISSAVSVLLTLCGVGAWYVLNHKVLPANQPQSTVGSAIDGGYEGDQQANNQSENVSSGVATPQEHDYHPMIGFRRRQPKQTTTAAQAATQTLVAAAPVATPPVTSPYASSGSRTKQSAKASERDRRSKPAAAQPQPQAVSAPATSAPAQKNWFLSLFQPGSAPKNAQNAASQQMHQPAQSQQTQQAAQPVQQPQGLFGQPPQMQLPGSGMPSPAQMMPHNHAGSQQLLSAHQGNGDSAHQQQWGQQNQQPHQQQMWGQQPNQQPNQQAHQQQIWQQQQAAMQQQQQMQQQAAMQQQQQMQQQAMMHQQQQMQQQQQQQQQPQQMQQVQQVQQQQPPVASHELHTQAVSLNNAGVQLLGDNPARAIEKFKEALQLDPNYITASKNLGRAYHNNANKLRNSGDTAGADFNYRMSIRLLSQTLGNDHQDTRIAREDYDSFLAQTKQN